MKDLTNYLEVSRDALRRNGESVAAYVGVPVIGVVKCGGCGVSVEEAARAWQAAGVTMFGVSLPREALELRRAGFTEDILLMSPVADEDTLEAMLDHGVILTVSGLESAEFYSVHGGGSFIRVHVAVDTGMGRFGVRWTDTQQLKAIYSQPGLIFEGIFSHFAKSFEKNYRFTKLQLERFLTVTEALTKAGFPVGLRHIAESCAALRFPETRLDAVRVGSALVGRLPVKVPVQLEDAAVFRARVVERKVLLPGDTTGYGAAWKVKKRTEAVVVAIGTHNGFGAGKMPEYVHIWDGPVLLYRMIRGNLRPPCVMYRGKSLPLVGRIGNQYTLFDATGLDIAPGEYVTARTNLLAPGQERVFVPHSEKSEEYQRSGIR